MAPYLIHFNAGMPPLICFAELEALLSREGLVERCAVSAGSRARFPFVPVRFSDDEEAARVLRCAVQVRHWYALWTPWCRTLHGAVRALSRTPPALLSRACAPDRTWRVFVSSERARRLPPNASISAIREHLRGTLQPAGRVELSDACDATIMVLLDFEPPHAEEGALKDDGFDWDIGDAGCGSYDDGPVLVRREVCAATGGLCAPDSVGVRGSCDDSAGDRSASASHPPGAQALPYRVLIGMRHDTSRHLVNEQGLSRRPYLGPTTLDPEVRGRGVRR